jgi:hypothetical protein
MPDTYTLPDTPDGAALAFNLSVSLRKAGYKTFMRPETLGRFAVLVLYVTPAKRASRKERGL